MSRAIGWKKESRRAHGFALGSESNQLKIQQTDLSLARYQKIIDKGDALSARYDKLIQKILDPSKE